MNSIFYKLGIWISFYKQSFNFINFARYEYGKSTANGALFPSKISNMNINESIYCKYIAETKRKCM